MSGKDLFASKVAEARDIDASEASIDCEMLCGSERAILPFPFWARKVAGAGM